jgi:hypothetical protein
MIDRVNHVGVVGGKVEEVCATADTLQTAFDRCDSC